MNWLNRNKNIRILEVVLLCAGSSNPTLESTIENSLNIDVVITRNASGIYRFQFASDIASSIDVVACQVSLGSPSPTFFIANYEVATIQRVNINTYDFNLNPADFDGSMSVRISILGGA